MKGTIMRTYRTRELTKRMLESARNEISLHRAGSLSMLLLPLLGGMGMARLSAQTFNSGSDGSYGPLTITSNTTLEVPANGIFHCTTIDVAPATTLTFRRNFFNTPVYLLATSNVAIRGAIDLAGAAGSTSAGGLGGPGGFDG